MRSSSAGGVSCVTLVLKEANHLEAYKFTDKQQIKYAARKGALVGEASDVTEESPYAPVTATICCLRHSLPLYLSPGTLRARDQRSRQSNSRYLNYPIGDILARISDKSMIIRKITCASP